MDISADLRRQSPLDRVQRTVTGASIHWTLASSTRISRAFRQSSLTCASLIVSHRRSCASCLAVLSAGESNVNEPVEVGRHRRRGRVRCRHVHGSPEDARSARVLKNSGGADSRAHSQLASHCRARTLCQRPHRSHGPGRTTSRDATLAIALLLAECSWAAPMAAAGPSRTARTTVAFLGPLATYSHQARPVLIATSRLTAQATLELFGDDENVDLRPCKTIRGARAPRSPL